MPFSSACSVRVPASKAMKRVTARVPLMPSRTSGKPLSRTLSSTAITTREPKARAMWYPYGVLQTPGPPFYDGDQAELFGEIFDALRNIGREGFLDSDDMAALDEYHPLGRGATLALAELAKVSEGEEVIDVGAGLGGAARVLARYYGAKVTALDATPRFNALNEVFTDRSRLED